MHRRLFLLCAVLLASPVSCAGPLTAPRDHADGGGTTGGGGSTLDGFEAAGGGGEIPPEEEAEPGTPCDHPGEPGLCVQGTAVPCYEGPAETEGVGMCQAGIRQCGAWGTAYGPCMQQVLPRPDNCVAPTEWICDGEPAPCRALVDVELQDPPTSGQVIAAYGDNGVVRGFVSVTHGFVLERVEDGAIVWSNEYDLSSWSEDFYRVARSLAVDGEGNIIVTGGVKEGLTLESTQIEGSAFIAKLDPDGSIVWVKIYDAWSQAGDAAVGPGDDIWVVGRADDRAFIERLDRDGTTKWKTELEPAAYSVLLGLGVASDGSAYAGGMESDQVSCGADSALIAAFDPDGELRWRKEIFSVHGSGAATSVVPAEDGGVYFSGRINTDPHNGIDLGDGEMRDGMTFVAKYSQEGNHVWGHAARDQPRGPAMGGYLELDPAGHLLWVDQDQYSFHMRTYDTAGTLLWERTIESETLGNNPYQFPAYGVFDVAMLPDGRVVVAGSLAGNVDFGAGVDTVSPFTGFWATYAP